MSEAPKRLVTALADRYTIERKLGAGGMATVYLAHDLKHDRKVAVKVLKPELAAVLGAERFLQEIKVTANLQHPHILPLFDSGQAVVPPLHTVERGSRGEADAELTPGGQVFLYYVMPFIDGQSLRDKLNREKQLPVQVSVAITNAVASALDYAHRQNVIHRDIKPENILLHDGQPMVADFGIALAVQAAAGTRLTETGLSLGTPHYMSPEQATAERKLDGRSDVYSLACVTYEMLAGDPPFTAPTAQGVVAKILSATPELLTQRRRTVSLGVSAAVNKALEKLPADRFASAGDFAKALSVPSPLSFVTADHRARGHRHWDWTRVALVSGWIVAGIAVLFLTLGRNTSPDVGPTYLPLSAPPGVDLIYDITSRPTIAISPDGRHLVFTGSSNGLRLYRQDLDALSEATPIPGTSGGVAPFFSPDGEWVGFVGHNQLQKVSLRGGEPMPLASVSYHDFRGGTWSADGGTIYYAAGVSGEIWKVGANGGPPARITTPDRDGFDNAHFWPRALPDNDKLLYTSCCGRNRIMLLDVSTGARRTVLENGFYATYVSTGHLVFAQGGSLMAATFDLETLKSGPPIEVLGDVITGVDMHAEYAVSENGSLAYLSGRSAFEHRLVRLDRNGSTSVLDPALKPYNMVMSFAPDGARLALSLYDGNQDIVLFDLEQRDFDHLIVDDHNDFWPIWSREGKTIAFTSVRSGYLDLYQAPADKSDAAQLLYHNEYPKWPGSWAPGDTLLVFDQVHPETRFDIWLYSVNEERATPLRTEPFNEAFARFSPDGQWLAYHSDQSGQLEVYVVPFPGPGGQCKVSNAGGADPQWTADGTELFYRQDATAVVVQVAGLANCSPQPRELLYGLEPFLWAVAPSGDYFVSVEPRPTPRLRLVLNWFEELKERVPPR